MVAMYGWIICDIYEKEKLFIKLGTHLTSLDSIFVSITVCARGFTQDFIYNVKQNVLRLRYVQRSWGRID